MGKSPKVDKKKPSYVIRGNNKRKVSNSESKA